MDAGLGVGLFALLGLLVGSFLNVVVYRLPRMMEARWAQECAQLRGDADEADAAQPFNLMVPRSRCRACGHTLSWWENLPLLSFVLLRGRCSHCAAPISWRYPMVEAATGLLFAICAGRWGAGAAAGLWCALGAALLVLALIDWDTTYLPDDVTLPLLWAGLLANSLGWLPTGLPAAVWGAAVGYTALWSIYWLFKLLTGKEGMGYGDFKLLAALGAWLGWQALVPIVLLSSVIGAGVGLALKATGGLRDGGVMPFGPFLAGAGLAVMFFGAHRILAAVGLA